MLILSMNALALSEESLHLKKNIISMAKSYEGKGDPDYKIQNTLAPLVEKLISLNPQPPVKERLNLLYGTWKQVWGPYDYRNNNRGVDPTLGVNEIYQVISKDGFYYNVSPIYKKNNKDNPRIGYLKGEYSLDNNSTTNLNVHFVKYPGMKFRPDNREIFDFVEEAENDNLPNETTIVPTLIVKYFFQGGALVEVYTDEDTRILYGSNGKDFKNKYLYIMTKVNK
jgi:hypothetical protein